MLKSAITYGSLKSVVGETPAHSGFGTSTGGGGASRTTSARTSARVSLAASDFTLAAARRRRCSSFDLLLEPHAAIPTASSATATSPTKRDAQSEERRESHGVSCSLKESRTIRPRR